MIRFWADKVCWLRIPKNQILWPLRLWSAAEQMAEIERLARIKADSIVKADTAMIDFTKNHEIQRCQEIHDHLARGGKTAARDASHFG